MEKILLNIAVILIAAKVGGIICQKIKMPEVLGALVVGVLLGPLVFGIIENDSDIKLLSNLGVILLMFLAGLETNIEQFKRAGKSAFIIALMGIVVPLILGTLGAFIFFDNTLENIFIGVILTATSVSITVETLSELGKLNTKVGINILGAAVIDDILGLVLIAGLLAMNSSDKSTSLITTVLNILVFCIAGVLAIIFIPKVFRKFSDRIRPGRTLLLFSIAATLIIAFVAESVGIAAITGAYLCGLLFSQLPHKEYLEHNIKAISAFLTPIFFVSVGLAAAVERFSIKILFISLVMFIVAVIGKAAGCTLASRFFKMRRYEALQIGIGMISRGEIAIITANIGLQNNIITQEVFVPTIIVVLLTTMITPILLKVAFSHKIEHRLG